MHISTTLQEAGDICGDNEPLRAECRLTGSDADSVGVDAASSNDLFEVGYTCTVDGLLCLSVNQTGGATDGDCEDFEVRYVCEVLGIPTLFLDFVSSQSVAFRGDSFKFETSYKRLT